jgi:putative FmdB family regulatory protein
VPTYEYECSKCPRVFEVRQRITEAPLTTCDVCGGPVRRLLSAAPFILKGEGWYVTDYPSEARKKAAKTESPSSDSSAAPAGTSEKSSTAASPSSSSPSSGDSAKPAKSDKPAESDKPTSSAAS